MAVHGAASSAARVRARPLFLIPTPWLGFPGIVFLPGTRVMHTGVQEVRCQLQITHLPPVWTAQGPSPRVLGRPERWALLFSPGGTQTRSSASPVSVGVKAV